MFNVQNSRSAVFVNALNSNTCICSAGDTICSDDDICRMMMGNDCYNCFSYQNDCNDLTGMEFMNQSINWINPYRVNHEKSEKKCFFCGAFCWGLHSDHYKMCVLAQEDLDKIASRKHCVETQIENLQGRIKLYVSFVEKQYKKEEELYIAIMNSCNDNCYDQFCYMRDIDDEEHYGLWEQKADFCVQSRSKKSHKKKQQKMLLRQPTKKFKLDHKMNQRITRVLQEPLPESIFVDLLATSLPSISNIVRKKQREKNVLFWN